MEHPKLIDYQLTAPVQEPRQLTLIVLQMADMLGLYRAELASPHFSPPFVARRYKGAAWVAFATEERAGIVDTMSSTPTERKPARACHCTVAVEGW